MANKLAIEINEVLHKAVVERDSLAYHMARGLSEKIAAAITREVNYQPWEYVVRTLHALPQGTTRCPSDAELTAQLDSEGDQEWELVSFDFATSRAIFKRRKTVK